MKCTAILWHIAMQPIQAKLKSTTNSHHRQQWMNLRIKQQQHWTQTNKYCSIGITDSGIEHLQRSRKQWQQVPWDMYQQE